jgi:hypothetical protein
MVKISQEYAMPSGRLDPPDRTPDDEPCPTCGHRFDQHDGSPDGTLQWCLGGGYTDDTEYGTPKCLCRWFE